MSQIQTRFAYGAGDSENALIPLEVFNAKSETVYRDSVRMGSAVLKRDFDPGTYLVRATLPSGEVLSKTVEVKADRSVEVLLRPRRQSPRENLGWAYYLQSSVTRPLELMVDRQLPQVRFWQHNTSGWTEMILRPDSKRLGNSTYVNFDASLGDTQPGVRLLVELQSHGDWRRWELGQFWVQVEAEGFSRMMAVPPAPTIGILVVDAEPHPKDSATFRIVAASGDPTTQALLGYLSSGDFESARNVGTDWYKHVQETLKSKIDDPGMAAIAGYLLLEVGDAGQLDDWTRTLARGTPWLPDGPIIRAAQLLAGPDPEPKDVADWMLEAVRRGLPMFTQGLRLLYDGLGNLKDYFAANPEPEWADRAKSVAEQVEFLRPYCASAIWQSPFTCFSATHPEDPQLAGTSVRPVPSIRSRAVGSAPAKLWEDVNGSLNALSEALNTFNWGECNRICDGLIAYVGASKDPFPEKPARQILNMLRRKRRFNRMRTVAEALLRHGQRSPQIRRQLGQALIELKEYPGAEEVLTGILNDSSLTSYAGEAAEATGLLGRVYKQRYCEAEKPSKEDLLRAIKLYFDVYHTNPEGYLWHGINTVALLARARKDHVAVAGYPSLEDIAQSIDSFLNRMEVLWYWDRATAVENAVALHNWQGAYDHLLYYAADSTVDAFECGSLLRQLVQVWQLSMQENPGRFLLPTLQGALLAREGGRIILNQDEVRQVSGRSEEATRDFDKRFGTERYQPLRWYKTALARCRAGVRVKSAKGEVLGSGCLVRASDFFPQRSAEEILLLTSDSVWQPGSRLDRVELEAAGEKYSVTGEVWSVTEVGVTLTALGSLPGVEICPVGPPAAPFDRSKLQRLCVIDSAGDSVQLQECAWVDASGDVLRYRAPFDRPAPGTPVFDPNYWSLIGITRRSSEATSEATSIEAITRATASAKP